MIELTIFTPVYNRKEEIKNLYFSLLNQNNHQFKWLIVDDGSDEPIEELVKEFQKNATFSIRYIYQMNAGKHVAFNTALNYIDTNYVICVDSDDTLTLDAINTINENINEITSPDLIGFIFPKNNILNISEGNYKLVQIITKYKKAIELAIIINTNILRKNKFPVYTNEKFLSEEIVYNNLDNEGEYYFVDKCIYLFDYQDDGITLTINKHWCRNPQGTFHLLKNRYDSFKYIEIKKRLYRRIRCTLVYDAFCIKKDLKQIKEFNNLPLAILLLPFSYVVYLIKFKKIKE